jgi:serine-type D-Ala-D-Ala carboxypeptidase/endopeptidase
MAFKAQPSGGLSRRAFLHDLGLLGISAGTLALTGSLPAFAQTQTPQSPTDKAIAAQVNTLITNFTGNESAVGLAVGVIYPGSKKKAPPVTQRFFWGETTQGNGQPPASNTIFGIGSVGKVFTTTLLADMVFNQKLLALNDLVQPYYDKFAPGVMTLPTFNGEGIRFVHLATHTAGLPDQPKSIHSDACGTPMAAIYDFLSHYKLPQAPGAIASYSDMGFDILSDILNLISASASRDQSLTDLISRAKLTMPDTGAITLARQKDPRYATGYDSDSKGNLSPAALITCDSGSDHVGQVASTLDDMIEWVMFNLGLTDSPFNSLLPEIQKQRHQMGAPTDFVGLGWQMHPLVEDPKQYYLSKDGSSQLGFSADIVFTPTLSTASVILSNVNAIAVPDVNLKILNAANKAIGS